MKKRLLIVAGLLLSGVLWAQTEKGNGLITGTVSVNHTTTGYSNSDSRSNSWNPNLDITAGHFVADNWLLGLSTSFASGFAKQDQQSFPNQGLSITNNTVDVGITPFVRRYWRFSTAYVFVGAGLTVGIDAARQENVERQGTQLIRTDQGTNGFSVAPRLEAGLNYFLSNRLGLQLVASANSLPFNVAGLSAGLVYWTGPNRRQASPQKERANPQTDKGRWLLEGSFAVNNQKADQYVTSLARTARTTNTAYSISPSIGFFIKKNSILGISVPVTYTTNKFELDERAANIWTVGISPYYQRYWTSTRLTPYTRVSATYNLLTFGRDASNVNVYGAAVNLGLAYMAGQRFIVETSLGNASVNYVDSDGSNTWNANLSAGLTGNLAVRYVFK